MIDTSGLVLVAGSNGRIGSALVRRLTRKYGQVSASTRRHEPRHRPTVCVSPWTSAPMRA
jgi:uncharacterized protein YbjT (DUF2867 family)